ncbi:NEDD4 family-interacting protein 1-like isoform X1 [Euwallacea similis]|uniref:NEDD4 family-interacting protein 1-like isoform X1 n=1 Tax=Euwallacea similis TaxID=1736056 RepID=UPI00344B6A53
MNGSPLTTAQECEEKDTNSTTDASQSSEPHSIQINEEHQNITANTEHAVNVTQALPCTLNYVDIPTSSSLEDIPPPKPDYNAPPPYEVATQTSKLPTYEEVQREKHLEEELGVPIVNNPSQYRSQPVQRILMPIDNEAAEDVDTSLLGTDFMFYIAFFVAFIFNWIGFLLLMCFCHTIASRYGALSGFGLSLAKWTFIVQHSTELASKDNSWLWWLIMTFGLIICIRAILQYLNIKRGWHMLSASHQERLLFFY